MKNASQIRNKEKQVGQHVIGGMVIPVFEIEPCFRISQWSKGQPITCSCTICADKGQSPEEAKRVLDEKRAARVSASKAYDARKH